MIVKLQLGTVVMLAWFAAPAFAMVDQMDEAGETTLQTTQSGFDIRVKGADEAGNSARVEVRPRNGNCVTSNAYKVTPSGVSSIDGTDMGQPAEVSLYPTLHDNPMCNDSKFGYFSVDRVSDFEHTIAYVLHGTEKSYRIEVTFSDLKGGGKSQVIELRSN